MSKEFSIVTVGLAADDQIFFTRDGVAYPQLREKIPQLPEKEGGLTFVYEHDFLDWVVEQMAQSGLFEEDTNGIKGMHVKRNPGGGLNALLFTAAYAAEIGLPPLAGAFAFGSVDGKYDESAQYLMESGQKAGIDMTSFAVPRESTTPRTVAIVRKTERGNPERTFLHNPGVADIATTENYIKALEECSAQAAMFFYLNIGKAMSDKGGEGIRDLFENLRGKQIVTVLDAAGDRNVMREKGYEGLLGSGVLEQTVIFGPGAAEAYSITGAYSPHDIARVCSIYREEGPAILLLKNGPGGSYVITGKSLKLHPLLAGFGGERVFSWLNRTVITQQWKFNPPHHLWEQETRHW